MILSSSSSQTTSSPVPGSSSFASPTPAATAITPASTSSTLQSSSLSSPPSSVLLGTSDCSETIKKNHRAIRQMERLTELEIDDIQGQWRKLRRRHAATIQQHWQTSHIYSTRFPQQSPIVTTASSEIRKRTAMAIPTLMTTTSTRACTVEQKKSRGASKSNTTTCTSPSWEECSDLRFYSTLICVLVCLKVGIWSLEAFFDQT